MKQFHWLNIAIFFIVVSSLIPLAFSGAVQADSVKGNLKELTDAADSILVGTVTERSSYWNDEHTRIYTSVVFSVEDRIKGEAGPDNVTITVPGGEVEGLGELVSEMPSFAQGEKAVVFLKKLNKAQLPQAKSLPDKFPAQQFEVYAGFRGKFPIKGDKIDSLPVAEFKDRVNKIVGGQALPATELDISPSLVTMPYLYAGYSWPHPPAPVIPYRINENASSCTGEGAAVQNAATTWAAAGANFSFSYAGTTTATAYGFDGVNEIMWVNMGGTNILAVTYIWYSGSTILENDVEFNKHYNWSTSPTCPGGYYDVQSVGLHEFGHWLCLSDLYNAADAAKVMYGYASSGTTKRALTADDIAGIQSIYGASAPSEPDKLIGADDAAGYNEGADVTYTRFQTVANGTVTQFRVKAGVNSQVKVAIYSDNGGSPGSRLVNNDTAQNVSPGWNTLSIPSLTVTNGTYYWLAVAIKDTGASQFIWGGTMKWQVGITFSSFAFPATAGSGLPGGSYTELVAGWATPSLPPDAAPILTSPGASVTFKWGTAERATTYWLQVNTQSDFSGTNPFNAEVGNVTTQEVTGLSLSTTYYWRVKAGNASGWGPWSAVRSVLANTAP